jgi:hypothetical protein
VRLPNADRAIVEPAKVRDYLLSSEHPVGRAKARFFAALGFTRDNWPELQAALLVHAAAGEAELDAATLYGQKYTVRGILQGPAGRNASVIAAWMILQGEDAPRFVTAYPGERL